MATLPKPGVPARTGQAVNTYKELVLAGEVPLPASALAYTVLVVRGCTTLASGGALKDLTRECLQADYTLKGKELPRQGMETQVKQVTLEVQKAYKDETVSLVLPGGRLKTGPVKLVDFTAAE